MNKTQRQLDTASRIANRHVDAHPWWVAIRACNAGPKADFGAFLAGLLHDSLEDGYASEGELRSGGIPDDVVNAVLIVTRGDGEKYMDYIARVKKGVSDQTVSKLARRVKLADAEVNLERCQIDPGYAGMEKRYRKVIAELS